MDSLDFSPLKELSDQIAANDTDVLFLMGPLLDANNSLVKYIHLHLNLYFKTCFSNANFIFVA